MKYKLRKTDSKMAFIIPHFYLLVMKTSTQIQATQLKAFQIFEKMIGQLDFQISDFQILKPRTMKNV